MALYTGSGEDELQVTDSSTRRLWIDMGSGDDFADLDNLSADRYSIQGGRGVDVLDVTLNDPLVEGRMEGAQRGFESVQ